MQPQRWRLGAAVAHGALRAIDLPEAERLPEVPLPAAQRGGGRPAAVSNAGAPRVYQVGCTEGGPSVAPLEVGPVPDVAPVKSLGTSVHS